MEWQVDEESYCEYGCSVSQIDLMLWKDPEKDGGSPAGGHCPQVCGKDGFCCNIDDPSSCPQLLLKTILLTQPSDIHGFKCVKPVDETQTHNWLSQDETCYHKCGFHGGRCEKLCGEDGFCCNGNIYDPENQDCPLIARLSIPKYKDDFVCVQKGSNHFNVSLIILAILYGQYNII